MRTVSLEGLDLNLMLALHWLLAEQGVTAAAARLGLSQPATSRTLARLRDLFDDPLLIQTGRSMSLSPKAERLKPQVARAIAEMRRVMSAAEDLELAAQTGAIRIACSDHWGALIAAKWIQRVTPHAPHLELDLVEIDDSVIPALIAGRVDFALVPDVATLELPAHLNTDQFIFRPIYRDRYVCALRADHPLAGQALTPERYLEMAHILVNPRQAQTGVVDRLLHQQGKARRITYRAAQFFTALEILQQTNCLLTAPQSLFLTRAENLRLLAPPLAIPDFTVNVAWHPNWSHGQLHGWLRAALFSDQDWGETPAL